jgi:GrpB-like predicted nucleotidyltransferase (UPF0157 family)
MPFADEAMPVELVPYQDCWRADFETIARTLEVLDVADHRTVEHIGSTAVPGLMAKDVIDIQVRVDEIDAGRVTAQFTGIAFRRRPEDWNNAEQTRSGVVPKLVFAPPVGHRHCNVHVRLDGSVGARDALLFRDFLRADTPVRTAWSQLKLAIIRAIPGCDLLAYGQIKQPAWLVLMDAADRWARDEGWVPSPLV